MNVFESKQYDINSVKIGVELWHHDEESSEVMVLDASIFNNKELQVIQRAVERKIL